MAELLPCPFCGKKEAYLTRNCYGQNYVRCPNCGAVVWGNDNESLTEKRAVELWNTRAPKERGGEKIKGEREYVRNK